MMEDRILDSLGRIDGDMIASAAKLRGKKKRRPNHWVWRAAACLVLMCSLAVTVEASSGAVSNLLAPVFGGARTEIVEGIGVPVGVSASADGYTMTVDAIIGDRYNVAVVYTLTREDGQPIPEGVRIDGWKSDVLKGGGGGSLSPVKEREEPCQLQFVEEWNSRGKIIGRYVTTRFSDLVLAQPDGEEIPLAEGPWELSYTLCYEDSTRKVPVKDLEVTDLAGVRYGIEKIQISPIGLHMDMTRYNPVPEEWPLRSFAAAIQLTDGTVMELEGSSGQHFRHGAEKAEAHYTAMFRVPVALEDVRGLVICGTVYPLNLE